MSNLYTSWASATVAAPLMSLHVAPYTEGLTTPTMWTFEWLLPCMRMAMYP